MYLSFLVLKVLCTHTMNLSYFRGTEDEVSNLISYDLNFFTLYISFLVVPHLLVKDFGNLYCILSRL